MHYAAVLPELFVPSDLKANHRRAEKEQVFRSVPGAWGNWWTMSVEEPPSPTPRHTRVIRARGRMSALVAAPSGARRS